MSSPDSKLTQNKAALPPLERPVVVSVTAEKVGAHIAQHLGAARWTWRDNDAVPVAVDIHVVAPSPRRNFWVLVTSGMSDRAMNIPNGSSDRRFVELTMVLPPTWQLVEDQYKPASRGGDKNGGGTQYWPVHWLKYVAKHPHNFGSKIGAGDVIPNGSPAAPLSSDTKQCGILVASSTVLPKDFFDLRVDRQKPVRFYALWPVYKEEMDLRTRSGPQSLFDRLEKARITDQVDLARKNVGIKFLGLF